MGFPYSLRSAALYDAMGNKARVATICPRCTSPAHQCSCTDADLTPFYHSAGPLSGSAPGALTSHTGRAGGKISNQISHTRRRK